MFVWEGRSVLRSWLGFCVTVPRPSPSHLYASAVMDKASRVLAREVYNRDIPVAAAAAARAAAGASRRLRLARPHILKAHRRPPVEHRDAEDAARASHTELGGLVCRMLHRCA